jgi:hypothetical protein
MGTVFNLEPKNKVTMLTREEWTKGISTPVVKGLVWFTDGSKMEGTELDSMDNLWEEVSLFL